MRRYLYYRCGDTTISTDLAQDTFMRIWEKQMELLPEKDTGLLYKIAGDLFVSHTRRERLRREAPKEIRIEQSGRTPEEELQYQELQEKYEKTLMKLPENQRVVFLMSRMEELTYQEIATRLSLSVKTVEKRVSGALSRLRKELKT
ncbi:MAG: sigma-70 family RNA polymerase sigma factor [Bacteroidales bacterium]|nr:sigma-70 family RNA polymerase sigma factor [Bacteroidales bacterium]